MPTIEYRLKSVSSGQLVPRIYGSEHAVKCAQALWNNQIAQNQIAQNQLNPQSAVDAIEVEVTEKRVIRLA